jgi:hypothetical protein
MPSHGRGRHALSRTLADGPPLFLGEVPVRSLSLLAGGAGERVRGAGGRDRSCHGGEKVEKATGCGERFIVSEEVAAAPGPVVISKEPVASGSGGLATDQQSCPDNDANLHTRGTQTRSGTQIRLNHAP